jgi:hypothetical protein
METLRAVWAIDRDQLLRAGLVGTRPWALWAFDLGEERPRSRHAEAVRLAELGVLAPDELAALEEAANEARMRVGTPREHISGSGSTAVSMDREAVELWDAVRGARR